MDINFSSAGDEEHGDSAELPECIHVLADRVGDLSKHRADLLDRYSKAEAANDQLTKELEKKTELINTLYMEHQSNEQVFFVVINNYSYCVLKKGKRPNKVFLR